MPSPGAVRAAEAIQEVMLDVSRTGMAEIIDREIGLAELAEALAAVLHSPGEMHGDGSMNLTLMPEVVAAARTVLARAKEPTMKDGEK